MRAIAIVMALAVVTPTSAEPRPNVTTRLHRVYGTPEGYAAVTRDVMKWHKTRRNGCVAFASTALRRIGVAIPTDVQIDGSNVSRITGAFSRYLAETLGWTRIDVLDELRPGDIVFSTDAPCCPGYPNHVVMFDGWLKRERRVARVVDNNGFHIARPMFADPDAAIDGFGYALRAPK